MSITSEESSLVSATSDPVDNIDTGSESHPPPTSEHELKAKIQQQEEEIRQNKQRKKAEFIILSDELKRIQAVNKTMNQDNITMKQELDIYKQKEKDEEEREEEAKNRIPDIVIIVPYRDRRSQRSAFTKIMPLIMKSKNYKIYYIHQRDNRPFNRGAMKNLGFLYIKGKYPKHYATMNIVFHDIDVMPWSENQFSYITQSNMVNHFYGFKHALGGILAMKGADFDRINGFPNIWTWGLEDNTLQMRCIKNRIRINRSEFVSIDDDNKNIISLWHGWNRLISPNIEPKWKYDNGRDGIRTLRNIRMKETVEDENFIEVNVLSFQTGEPLSSPYVKNAKMRNARHHVRQNQPVLIQRVKRGAAGSFGGGRGLRGMLM